MNKIFDMFEERQISKMFDMLWILGLVVASWNMPRFLAFVVPLIDPDASINKAEAYAYIAFFILITGSVGVSLDRVRDQTLREFNKRINAK
jgi:hypothetical protein